MIILVLKEILPEGDAPYTLHEIALRCRAIDPACNYGKIHHAWSVLKTDPERAADVTPLRSRAGTRQHRFSHIAAQRIARQACKGVVLKKLRTKSPLPPR